MSWFLGRCIFSLVRVNVTGNVRKKKKMVSFAESLAMRKSLPSRDQAQRRDFAHAHKLRMVKNYIFTNLQTEREVLLIKITNVWDYCLNEQLNTGEVQLHLHLLLCFDEYPVQRRED